MPVPTRQVFGNVEPWMQTLFYAMMLASLCVLGWRLAKRVRLWRQGEPRDFERDWRKWLGALFVYALLQKRVLRRSFGGLLHLLLFSGFVVLALGTTLLTITHLGPVNFHVGWYYLIYELTMDVFGVAFCLGCVLAIYRRLFRRPASLGHDRRDWMLLALLLSIGVTGFALEALRIGYTQVPANHARWSIVAWTIHSLLLRGVTQDIAQSLHLALWWLHAVLVATLFASIPVTRMLHTLTGPLNIALRPDKPMGALVPISIEQVEETGRIGASAIEHFSRQQLLSLDACMACGRCQDVCPAWAVGKPLSPKNVILDLQNLMTQADAELHGQTIRPETLQACTMCHACVQECPVLIGHVDLIAEMRRHLVGEGQLPGPQADALRRIGQIGSPHAPTGDDRMTWADQLDVPTVERNPDFEYLLWIGCAAAFDPRAQKIARATAQLLIDAGVSFAVLGNQERCTGDPARRIGDELLFQESAQHNIETLQRHKVKKIVTPCPHCFNTLANEYTQFGGHYQVQHHSQFLAELIDLGRLKSPQLNGEPITLHDPCYLARVNGETDAPRRVLGASTTSGTSYRELPRHGKNTFCCGAGGGGMWSDDAPHQRISHRRAEEVVQSGVKTLATACPFCLNMMSDALATVEGEEKVELLDIAEILVKHQHPA